MNADAKFGMVKVGGTFAYVQGDDKLYDDVEHDANTGGIDYNPCLLMFNYDTVNYWVGGHLWSQRFDNRRWPDDQCLVLTGQSWCKPHSAVGHSGITFLGTG